MDAVRVDPLSKTLGVTRGSFYWHFENRAALLRAVLRRWREKETERAIAENEAADGDAGARLLRLLRTCGADDGRLEMGMRDWAARDEEARSEIRKIDERRVAYMSSLAEGAGVPAEVATARCRVAYLAWLGTYTDATATGSVQQLRDMDTLWHMVMVQ